MQLVIIYSIIQIIQLVTRFHWILKNQLNSRLISILLNHLNMHNIFFYFFSNFFHINLSFFEKTHKYKFHIILHHLHIKDLKILKINFFQNILIIQTRIIKC